MKPKLQKLRSALVIAISNCGTQKPFRKCAVQDVWVIRCMTSNRACGLDTPCPVECRRSLESFLSLSFFSLYVQHLSCVTDVIDLRLTPLLLPFPSTLCSNMMISKQWKQWLYFSFLWRPGGSSGLLAVGFSRFLDSLVIHQKKYNYFYFSCYEHSCESPAFPETQWIVFIQEKTSPFFVNMRRRCCFFEKTTGTVINMNRILSEYISGEEMTNEPTWANHFNFPSF